MKASTPPGAATLIRSATPSPYATGITPWLFSHSWLLSLARPMTAAPVRRASWTASEPTPPGGPGDDDGLALPGLDGVHRPPRGRARDIQAAGHLPGDLLRLARQVAGLDQDQLGLGVPPVREPDHLVAGREFAGPGTDLLDDPGEVAALPGRERRGEQPRHRPRADDRLTDVDASRLHPDQDLPVPGHRAFHLLDPQHLDPAELVVPDCLWHDLCVSVRLEFAWQHP